jgi:hypothetical protein
LLSGRCGQRGRGTIEGNQRRFERKTKKKTRSYLRVFFTVTLWCANMT